jgi:predicted DNA-binding WGR domain protein
MSNGNLLYRIDPARNMRRFYHLTIETDLLGDTVLIRRWGRIGTDGKRRVDLCFDSSKANMRVAEPVRLKQRRSHPRERMGISLN